MNDLIGILGLILVAMLFNFTYPQNALNLLLKATDYMSRIKDDNDQDEARKLLRYIKGWFYTTDLVQFMLTFFIGAFVILFIALRVIFLASVFPILAMLLSIGCIVFYFIMLLLSWRRITYYRFGKDCMNRRIWLLGIESDEPFNSKYPIIVFLLEVVLSTLSLLVVVGLSLFNMFGVSSEEASLYSLVTAVVAILGSYLLNYWGLYIYMPASSVSILCEMANAESPGKNTEWE